MRVNTTYNYKSPLAGELFGKKFAKTHRRDCVVQSSGKLNPAFRGRDLIFGFAQTLQCAKRDTTTPTNTSQRRPLSLRAR